MTRRTVTALAMLVLASCRGRSELEAVRVKEAPSVPRVGALVDVDAFQFGVCDLEAVAFPSRVHGYVRDSCGNAYGTLDGGRSFVAVDPLNRRWKGMAPYPLIDDERSIEWRRFPMPVRVEGVVISIDSARRLLVVDGTELLPIRGRGSKQERLAGMAPSEFGLVAWTAHTVLSSDGRGPLVARGRVENDEIASAVRPFEREWIVRTKRGAILRTSKSGWRMVGEDPHALVVTDDFDRWLLERTEHLRSVSPIERGLAGEGTITVSMRRSSCSDWHRAVRYSLRRRAGALALSVDDRPPRTLSSAEAEGLQTQLLAALMMTAVPPRWSYPSQGLWITVSANGQPELTGHYSYPSPLADAVLRAFGE